jgi:hypothetical protein
MALGCAPVPTENETLPFVTRFWFAWLCFFKVLFDGRFAARVWGAREGRALPAAKETPSLPAPPPRAPAVVKAADETAALQLLSLLQREGRLVDFLQQDIASFPDADVGAAARVVHEGCRKALRAHAQIAPVRTEAEGSRVNLVGELDPDQVKLVGDVKGEPPYAGVLRHRGWKATKLELPNVVGEHDARILAPAEVELG